MKRRFLLITTLIAAFILRLYLIHRDSIPFAFDMGRDLLWAKDISFYHIPTLIGPAASIWGVYFGPFWFYFLSVPLYLSQGNPVSAVFATAGTIVATGLLAYVLFRKYLTDLYAFILSLIILFNSMLIGLSLYAFHANLLPLLTLLLIYFCFKAVVKSPTYIAGAFFVASLMFHADPAPAVVFSMVPVLIFLIFRLYKTKNLIKTISISVSLYLLPFIPQIIFEVRNNFVQTQALVAYFRGENPSLSGQLPFFERILNRFWVFFDFFRTGFGGGNNLVTVIFLVFIIFGIWKFFKAKKNHQINILAKIVISTLVFVFLTFTFVITVEVKGWYLFGVTILFSLLILFAIYSIRERRFLTYFFIIIFLINNIQPFFNKERIFKTRKDPVNLSNQLKAIDIVYDDASKFSNQNYSVYVFTPPIYDYNYQYLFWWQGTVKKRGLPRDFAYLANQPEYVRNKSVYQPNPQVSDTVYFILENVPTNEFYAKDDWLKNFRQFKTIWQKEINGAILVQKAIKLDRY